MNVLLKSYDAKKELEHVQEYIAKLILKYI